MILTVPIITCTRTWRTVPCATVLYCGTTMTKRQNTRSIVSPTASPKGKYSKKEQYDNPCRPRVGTRQKELRPRLDCVSKQQQFYGRNLLAATHGHSALKRRFTGTAADFPPYHLGIRQPGSAIKIDDYTIATSEGIPVSGVHDHAGIFSGAYSSVPETPDGLVFRHFKVGIPGTGGSGTDDVPGLTPGIVQ